MFGPFNVLPRTRSQRIGQEESGIWGKSFDSTMTTYDLENVARNKQMFGRKGSGWLVVPSIPRSRFKFFLGVWVMDARRGKVEMAKRNGFCSESVCSG